MRIMSILSCVVLVVVLSVAATITKGEEEEDTDDLYCPPAAAIDPCRCDRTGLSCIGVGRRLNETVARKVFSASVQTDIASEDRIEDIIQLQNRASATKDGGGDVHYYRSIWVQGTGLERITRQTFGEYMAMFMNLDLNEIATIDSGALSPSFGILQTLTVYKNRLKKFPFDDLKRMRVLRSLSLGYNEISEIPDEAFSGHPTLASILLDHNAIESVGRRAFEDLRQLTRISLAFNRIKIIDDYMMAARSQFSLMMDLSSNLIDSISPIAFESTYPIVFNLSNNTLDHLDYYVFAPMLNRMFLVRGGALIVSENPFHCESCLDNKWLITNRRRLTRVLHGFRCLDGRTLLDLTPTSIGCTLSNKN